MNSSINALNLTGKIRWVLELSFNLIRVLVGTYNTFHVQEILMHAWIWCGGLNKELSISVH